jgi:hypothetical protein
MTENARHHRANRDVQIVLVPYEVGSPKEGRRLRPPRYARQQHEPWRPQRAIPATKAEALRRFLERVNRQNEEVRAFMAEARRRAA